MVNENKVAVIGGNLMLVKRFRAWRRREFNHKSLIER